MTTPGHTPTFPPRDPHDAWAAALDPLDVRALDALARTDGTLVKGLPLALLNRSLARLMHAPLDAVPAMEALAQDLMLAGANPFVAPRLGESCAFQEALQARTPRPARMLMDALNGSGWGVPVWALRHALGSHAELGAHALSLGWDSSVRTDHDRRYLWQTVIGRCPVGEETVEGLLAVQVQQMQDLRRHHLLPASTDAPGLFQLVVSTPTRDQAVVGESRAQRAERQVRLLDAMVSNGLPLPHALCTRLLVRALSQRATMRLTDHLVTLGADPSSVRERLAEREAIELRQSLRTGHGHGVGPAGPVAVRAPARRRL